MTLIAHTKGDAESVIASIRREVKALDEQLPVYGVRDAPEFLDIILSGPKSIAATVSGFGLLALLLAAIGLYGVMSYAVAERTREIGVRVALGARSFDILRLVVRDGLRLTLIGLAIGLLISLGFTAILTKVLYGLMPAATPVFAAVVVLLAGVAMLACYLPARRATKVDPMVALRCD